MNTRLLLAALLPPLLTGGCLTSTTGQAGLCEEAPRLATRAQILQRLGGPYAVRTEPDGSQTLTYQTTCQKGGGLGAGYVAFRLLVLSQERRTDKVTFTVRSDGQVASRTIDCETARMDYTWWPF